MFSVPYLGNGHTATHQQNWGAQRNCFFFWGGGRWKFFFGRFASEFVPPNFEPVSAPMRSATTSCHCGLAFSSPYLDACYGPHLFLVEDKKVKTYKYAYKDNNYNTHTAQSRSPNTHYCRHWWSGEAFTSDLFWCSLGVPSAAALPYEPLTNSHCLHLIFSIEFMLSHKCGSN